MKSKAACTTFLIAGVLGAATAEAGYLAPDPGTQVSIQLNAHDTIVVRPVSGVWTHPVCPDVTAAVLTRAHFTRPLHGLAATGLNFDTVWDLLVQAAMSGRSVNLRVSDTFCHDSGYPLIESLRVFP